MNRSYTELIKLKSFKERFLYLKLDGRIGVDTFGHSRYLNQSLYSSNEWRSLRNKIIVRDNGCDLAVEGFEIYEHIIIHHINPITPESLKNGHTEVFEPENLITVSPTTHNAIHFGDASNLSDLFVERQPNDTIPWRR